LQHPCQHAPLTQGGQQADLGAYMIASTRDSVLVLVTRSIDTFFFDIEIKMPMVYNIPKDISLYHLECNITHPWSPRNTNGIVVLGNKPKNLNYAF